MTEHRCEFKDRLSACRMDNAALRARLAAAEESEKALEMAIAGIRAEHVHWSAYAARHRGVSADGRAWGLEFALRKLDALAAPAAAQPAAPSPGLVWTSESPKVAGRRWYRRKNGHEEIVRVTDLDLDIIDQPWAGWHGSQWAGPIPEPQEPADAGGGGE